MKEFAQEHQIYVVVGGGKIAREYIGKARALGANEMFCDLIGIGATKLNSALLVAALGEAAPQEIPEGYAEAARLDSFGKCHGPEALGKILLALDQNSELKCLNSSVLQFS